MTDIMKLADDYAECMYLRREKHEARTTLQSAIEALQCEVERLNRESQNLSNQLGDCDHARLAMKAERDALQAKLDELAKQEPVGFVAPHELKDLKEGFPITVVLFSSHKRTYPLYAAPKALEPLTDEQIKRIYMCETGWSISDSDTSLIDFARAILAAANGITKGITT